LVQRSSTIDPSARLRSEEQYIVPKSSTKSDIDSFLEAAAKLPTTSDSGRGRLILAFDATMSRQAIWDIAQSVQGRMFATAAAHGGIEVQLVYYRGFSECQASRFVAGRQSLASLKTQIGVGVGQTQIEKVLAAAYAAGGRRALEFEARAGGTVAADHLLSQMGQRGLCMTYLAPHTKFRQP
jgi:hypothetical protein